MKKKSINKRVVISGLYPICSCGAGGKEVFSNILLGKINKIKNTVKLGNKESFEYYIHKAPVLDVSQFIPNDNIVEIQRWKGIDNPIDLFSIIVAIKLAIDDSKIKEMDDVGLVLIHENPGLEEFLHKLFVSFEEGGSLNTSINFRNFQEFYEYLERSAYETQSFMFLHHVLKNLGIHGHSLIINNACSSGTYGIDIAAQNIQNNKHKIMIVGAADYPGIFKQLWLQNSKLYDKSGQIKVFSGDRNGFVLGEASCAVVLEEYEHAIKRKAPIYAEYLGGGFFSESWKVAYPAIMDGYYQKAVNQCLLSADLCPQDIDFVNIHGLGTKVGDKYECNEIKASFANLIPQLAAFKPYVGHTLGASALLETIIMILCLKYGMAPKVLYEKNPDHMLGMHLSTSNFDTHKVKFAMKNSYSFAGFISSSIFKKV